MSGIIWTDAPWASELFVPFPLAPSNPGVTDGIFDPRLGGALVWLVDLDAALDGGTLPVAGTAWAELAWGGVPYDFAPAGGVDTVKISDMGWRSLAADFGGVVPYPPLMTSGPSIERRVALGPGSTDSYAWGSLSITSPGLLPNTSLLGRDTAMRRVRIRVGMRTWDGARGIFIDPPSAKLLDVLTGMALTWRGIENGAEVPLRDPSAWLEAPISSRRFLGTGGVEGPTELTGTPYPIVRGGNASTPVKNCPAVLVNSASRIYRWTDVGSLVQVYEDGVAVYTNAGLVADVFATSVSAGQYKYDAIGQFRLGSDPAGEMTVDGYSGAQAAATIIRNLLVENVSIPGGMIDEGSFIGTAGTVPYAGGWTWTGQETAKEAIQPLLDAIGARLICSRSGGLRLWPLRAVPTGSNPVAIYDQTSAVSITPVPLDVPLTPPAGVWIVGYAKTHTINTTPKAGVSTAERERLATTWRTAAWSDPANFLRYAQASRPPTVETALINQIEAQGLANALGSLWGVPRTLWQVTLPIAAILLREIGDVVTLKWPIDGLRTGAVGQIIGDSVKAGETTASILVLI